MSNVVHLFDISPAVFAAVNEMRDAGHISTLEGMSTMGLLHLPFPDVAVRARYPALEDSSHNGTVYTYHYREPLRYRPEAVKVVGPKAGKSCPMVFGQIVPPMYLEKPHHPLLAGYDPTLPIIEWFGANILTYFLIALATRNIVKTDRLAGQKPRVARQLVTGHDGVTYISRTRLDMPALSAMPSDAQGSPRPHLRRGHAHVVRFGEKWSERRTDWFPPMFVNADPAFTPQSKHYKVEGRNAQPSRP